MKVEGGFGACSLPRKAYNIAYLGYRFNYRARLSSICFGAMSGSADLGREEMVFRVEELAAFLRKLKAQGTTGPNTADTAVRPRPPSSKDHRPCPTQSPKTKASQPRPSKTPPPKSMPRRVPRTAPTSNVKTPRPSSAHAKDGVTSKAETHRPSNLDANAEDGVTSMAETHSHSPSCAYTSKAGSQSSEDGATRMALSHQVSSCKVKVRRLTQIRKQTKGKK